MISNNTLKQYSAKALILGSLAILPFGASAMVTDHDLEGAEEMSASTVKSIDASSDWAAKRYVTVSKASGQITEGDQGALQDVDTKRLYIR